MPPPIPVTFAMPPRGVRIYIMRLLLTNKLHFTIKGYLNMGIGRKKTD